MGPLPTRDCDFSNWKNATTECLARQQPAPCREDSARGSTSPMAEMLRGRLAKECAGQVACRGDIAQLRVQSSRLEIMVAGDARVASAKGLQCCYFLAGEVGDARWHDV